MLKPVMQVAAGGVAAFLLWKIAAILLVPLLGIAAGLLLLVIKVVLFGLAVLVVWLVYRWMSRPAGTAA
jgi:hypothetical protein